MVTGNCFVIIGCCWKLDFATNRLSVCFLYHCLILVKLGIVAEWHGHRNWMLKYYFMKKDISHGRNIRSSVTTIRVPNTDFPKYFLEFQYFRMLAIIFRLKKTDRDKVRNSSQFELSS